MAIIHRSSHLYSDVSAIDLTLTGRSASRASIILTAMDAAVNLTLSAKSISKSNLNLIIVEPVGLVLAARTVSKSRLAIYAPDPSALDLSAVSVNSARLSLRVLRGADNRFVLTVRIAPTTRGLRHKDRHRFSVNNVEVPISGYSAEFPESAAGCTVNVTLARFADRSLITPEANYKFELASKIGGAWEWRTLIDSGLLDSTNLTIGFADRKRADSFSMSSLEPLASRLNKKPLRNLVVYDPNRVVAGADDYEVKFDTEGNRFETEILAIPSLTLYKLFSEVFVNRCGFADYRTNLPDQPIKETEFDTGSSFLDGVKGFVGSFEPDFTADGARLWIRDTTSGTPAGFPAPRKLTVDDYAAASVSQPLERLDAFNLIYFEDKEDFDTFETHIETLPLQKSGTPGSEDYSETRITRRSRRYYREAAPNVIVKEDLYEEERETKDYRGSVTGKVTEKFYYDGFGRPNRTAKTFESLVPAFDDPDSTLRILEQVADEDTRYIYGRHPFKPAKQVQLLVTRIRRGQIVVDSENLYRGEPFRQPVVVANRSGNADGGGISTVYGPVEKYTKTIQILPNEQVRSVERKEDLVSKNTEFDYSDVQYGEAASIERGRFREVLVFENPNDTFTGYGEEPFPVGELPLETAIALARRKLRRRKRRQGDLNCQLNGLELFMDRGIDYTVTDAEDAELGVFTIKGFRFTGSELGTRAARHQTTFRGARI